jgi:hypothetical protein
VQRSKPTALASSPRDSDSRGPLKHRRALVRTFLASLSIILIASAAPAPIRAGISIRIAIIVGPVGAELTPTYIALAERAAATAERYGATVKRAYSPEATPDRVLGAVAGADIVIYFGHGTGFPNPYSAKLNPATVNGWGLQGPQAHGTHDDSLADGSLRYYGEAWIAAHVRPAPGFVMIYSNVCYAPGAGEGGHPPSTPDDARQRAGGYARVPLAMGASAVFATDFYAGAADLVDRLLSNPTTPYGDVVRSGANYTADGVTVASHPYASGAELWLQRSPYFAGRSDYWFAFSGDPTASLASAGRGRLDALLAAVSGPLEIEVQPGEHLGLRIDQARNAIGEEHWSTAAVSRLSVAERRPLPGRDGAWYRIAAGGHAGAWIAESAAAHLPGLALQSLLQPERVVQLATGTHAGYRIGPDGTIDGSLVTDVAESSAIADRVALYDGQLYAHLTRGPFTDRWLLVSDAVRLAGPVPLPTVPSAAPSAGSDGPTEPAVPSSPPPPIGPSPPATPTSPTAPSPPPPSTPPRSATPAPSAPTPPTPSPISSASASSSADASPSPLPSGSP